MVKKFIDVMDTTFRDGFQSVFGARVLMDDFMPAVSMAKEAGITHFEFGGGARFQSLFFYLNENAFTMMDKFREIVGDEANLQTLSRGVNTVTLDTGSADMIDLHAKLFKKHGTTTIRNFDALNDINNLKFSAECIKKYGLKHEIVITMMDLPPNCHGAHDAAFYQKVLEDILESEIPFDSICFKDASGTSSPKKVYETIKMARAKLPSNTHIRLHTHETAGVSVACYQAALEAGVDGIDLAAAPVSGGTSQPDILTMLHATKGTNYDLGGLEIEKILKYENGLKECLKEYFLPPEAIQVNPIIPFSPMPGGALTANTQMMRDNNILDKFPAVIEAMREVVEKGGYGTSVTPVSQFYFQQAFNNVMFGKWNKISEGYGKMVLGYFGKTPTKANKKIIELAQKQLKLEPTTRNAMEIANEDETKSISYATKILQENNLNVNDENLFILLACKEKGLEYLKGNGKVMVRKGETSTKAESKKAQALSIENYVVMVNNKKYEVKISKDDFEVKKCEAKEKQSTQSAFSRPSEAAPIVSGGEHENDEISVISELPGNVFKILYKAGDKVKKDSPIIVLEAMKMEIEIVAPKSGTIKEIFVEVGQTVEAGDNIATIK